mgnify:CR=1 FL=1
MLCYRCGSESEPLYVHGHIQCSICNQVIDDCCQGEMCEKEVTEDEIRDKIEPL